MTPAETLTLCRFVAAACPQQAIDKYTPDAWHDLLGDLVFGDCKAAVIAVARRKPFVAPAEIREEVRRVRRERLAREILPAPVPELTDDPPRYRESLTASISSIADGRQVRRAIAPAGPTGLPADQMETLKARLGKAVPKLTPEEIAAQQAAASRAEREAADRKEAS